MAEQSTLSADFIESNSNGLLSACWLADRFSKQRVMETIKIVEVGIMLFAALAMTLSWLCLSLVASQPGLMASACLGGVALGFVCYVLSAA